MYKNDVLSRYSDKVVNVAFDNYLKEDNSYCFVFLLLGVGNFLVEAFPNAGHNYYEVLNSMYRYKKNYPDVDVKKIFEDSLILSFDYIISVEYFVMIMNFIFAQLENERKNVATFRIDVLEILNVLKSKLISKKELLEDAIFMNQLQNYNQILESNYGHKIM